MAESTSTSLLDVWNKLEEKLSSAASSSRPFLLPQVKKLNDMVYEVHSPLPEEKPQLEVLFFHGLQLKHGKDVYLRTWMSRDNSHLWLKTWLVELFPKARILMISYDASTKKTEESGRVDMYCTTENLVHCLTDDEVSIGQAGCPIVLVGHCLGGLLLKELCITAAWMLGPNKAETAESARIYNLFDNLRGMFFYGTPHNGSLLGDGLRKDFEEGELVDDIKILKASSARRNQQFDKLKSQCRWYTYGLCETRETYVDCLGKSIHVVPEASARSSMDLYYSVDADHHDLCQPDGKKASSLTCLRNFLNQIQEDGVCPTITMVDLKRSKGYVDLEGRAKQVLSMLHQQEIHTVFITGLSGVGKTALAQQIFHAIGHNFQVTCFVSLDTVEEPASNFRDQMLRQILEGLDTRHMISGPNLSSVLYYLRGKKVLMVLDNVASQEQLDALHIDIWLKGTASRLIVTTTNARLGTRSNTFEVGFLSEIESRQLFHHYAFDGGHGPLDLSHLITRVIDECENFPLSIKILGGYVSKGSIHHPQLWLDILDRLQKAQEVDSCWEYRLWAKLRVCYNILLPTEKEIFLDIATFFHGFPICLVHCIWQGSRESPHIAWSNLEQRFIASVDSKGDIWMHSHLRNLGKSIACPPEKKVAKWKRISSSSFAKELISKQQGIVNTVTLKLQISQGESLWLKKSTFLNYVHLKYLILEGVQATLSRVDLPRSLVYLRWTNGLFNVCPVDFTCLENLIVLQFRDCKFMESLSQSIECATKLKWLELDGCLSLTELPRGLSKCLQHLSLERTAVRELPRHRGKLQGLEMLTSLNLNYTGLTTLPKSIGNLTGLTNLELQGSSLTSLPNSIGRLKELILLDLTDSSMLGLLPESIGQLQSLTDMHLTSTCVTGLPQSIGKLANLRTLALSATPLETLPHSICNLRSLRKLHMLETQIRTIPDGIGELLDLEYFHLSSTNLKALPQTFGQLYGLRFLELDIGSLAKQHLLGLFSQAAGGQEEDMALPIQSLLSQLPLLQAVDDLHLYGREFPQSWMQPLFCALHLMPSLRDLHLYEFISVETIPEELGTLANLVTLHLDGLEALLELPESLGELCTLRDLTLNNNPSLNRLPDSLSALTLSSFDITNCESLQIMPRFVCHVSCGNATTSAPLDPPERLPTQCDVLLDSWRLAKCFLECPWKHFAEDVMCEIECKEMEKVRKKAIWRQKQGYVLDTKVAMELFEGQDLDFGGRHDGLQDISRPSYHSLSHHCAPQMSVNLMCCDWDNCGLDHDTVWVMDLSEESEENIEGEDESEDNIEGEDESEENIEGEEESKENIEGEEESHENIEGDEESEENIEGEEESEENIEGQEESEENMKGQDNLTDLNDESNEESQEGCFRGLCSFLLCCRLSEKWSLTVKQRGEAGTEVTEYGIQFPEPGQQIPDLLGVEVHNVGSFVGG